MHPTPRAKSLACVARGWAVVNGPGTAARIRMEGFEIAGKTGTAQVVSLGKDVGENKDHSWFVSYAPAERPEIAVVALVENVGFGSTYAAPAARVVYDAYYLKTRVVPDAGAVGRGRALAPTLIFRDGYARPGAPLIRPVSSILSARSA